MIIKKILPVVVIATLISGCAGQGPKETGGTLLGGVGGALIGSQIGGGRGQLIGVAVGTLAGAYLGQTIGSQLDERDKMMATQTTQNALEYSPDGRASAWHNPNSNNSGNVVPVRTFQNPQGLPCREFNQKIRVGGKEEVAFGKACRQPDGSWQIVN